MNSTGKSHLLKLLYVLCSANKSVRAMDSNPARDISKKMSSLDSLSHLNDTQIQTARLLRDTKNHYQASSPSGDSKQILNRIVREQAFTVLNRLCALRMAETRGILLESIGKAYSSKGFELYKRVAGSALGEIGDTYRAYLFSLFDEFAYDLVVLFDRYSPMGRLFPSESVLLALLDKINAVSLEDLWDLFSWFHKASPCGFMSCS